MAKHTRVAAATPKRVNRKSSKVRRQRPEELFDLVTQEGSAAPPEQLGVVSTSGRAYYEPSDLEDGASEASTSLGAAYGILTWSTWDSATRPFEERIKDFIAAFPPSDPLRYVLGGMKRVNHQEWTARDPAVELAAFLEVKGGGVAPLDRQLARFGLKRKGVAEVLLEMPTPKPQLQATRERNHALRVLHGSVDVEAKDMNAAKEAFMEQMEKRRAAAEVRAVRKRLKMEGPDEQA